MAQLIYSDAQNQALEDFQYEYNPDDEISGRKSLFSHTLPAPDKTLNPADGANRITQVGQVNFTFDAMGQPVTKTDGQGTTQFEWDTRGRLTKVTLPNDQTVSYGYDALGRRSTRTAGIMTTSFIYDDEEVVKDKNSDGSQFDYLNGIWVDEKLKQISQQGISYFLQDHLNSTIALTDSTGKVIERAQYEAFGETLNNSLTRYLFTGRERDLLTGLIYYRARWYDPQQGRFLTEDPLGLEESNPNVSLYVYVDNTPINAIDPQGLQKGDEMVGDGKCYFEEEACRGAYYHYKGKLTKESKCSQDNLCFAYQKCRKINHLGIDRDLPNPKKTCNLCDCPPPPKEIYFRLIQGPYTPCDSFKNTPPPSSPPQKKPSILRRPFLNLGTP